MKLIMAFLFLILCENSFSRAFPPIKRSPIKTNPSDYQILVTDQTTSTIDEATFLSLPYFILNLYYTESSRQRRSIGINNDWVKPYFTAWASEDDGSYFINFWGGLARIPNMNPQAWVFTVCHEIGHILAKTPRVDIDTMRWASAEGQSDHFATTVCMPKFFQSQKTNYEVPEKLTKAEKKICRRKYSEQADRRVCENILLGGKGFISALHYMKQGTGEESLLTPSSLKVEETMRKSYPSVQCRMDAFRLGAECFKDQKKCKRLNCWFKH